MQRKPEKTQASKRILLGAWGEQQASRYLCEQGYELVITNYRAARAQIDLIVSKPNLIVFVEVKTRSSINFGFGEQAVSQRQKNLILQGANHWLIQNNYHGPIRFDILAIHPNPVSGHFSIDHFEDAF